MLTNEQMEERGIDYDLKACFEYNYLNTKLNDVKKILAVWEGENDGDSWRWIIKLDTYGYDYCVYIDAGCDYTGWDCQSWINIEAYGDLDTCVKIAGLYLISEKRQDVVESLLNQLLNDKKQTWREEMNKTLDIQGAQLIDIPKKN